MPFPLAAVPLRREQVPGDQCGRLRLQRQYPSWTAVTVQPGEFFLGEDGRFVLVGVVGAVAGAGRVPGIRRVSRVRRVPRTIRIGGTPAVTGLVGGEGGIVVSEGVVVL